MPEVLEQPTPVTEASPASLPITPPDERLGRRSLLDQIERLEYELASLSVSAWPRKGLDFSVRGRGGPQLLSLGELEELRDELVCRLHDGHRALGERTLVEERHRCRIEEMLIEPERHRWVRVSNEDIGEPGCKHWHVRPRWGLLGMLMNWWRVRISSGCPLPTAGLPGHGAA